MTRSTNKTRTARKASSLILCAVAATGLVCAHATRVPSMDHSTRSDVTRVDLDHELQPRQDVLLSELLALEANGKLSKSWLSDAIERNIPEVNRIWEKYHKECEKFGLSQSQCDQAALEAAMAAAAAIFG